MDAPLQEKYHASRQAKTVQAAQRESEERHSRHNERIEALKTFLQDLHENSTVREILEAYLVDVSAHRLAIKTELWEHEPDAPELSLDVQQGTTAYAQPDGTLGENKPRGSGKPKRWSPPAKRERQGLN
jgi:hypothetical protein